MKTLAILTVIMCLSGICNAGSMNLGFNRIGVYGDGQTSSDWDIAPRKYYGELTIYYNNDKSEWCSVNWVGLEGWLNTSYNTWEYQFDSWEAKTGVEQLACFPTNGSMDITITSMNRTCKFNLGYVKGVDSHPDKVTSFVGECIQSKSGIKGAYQISEKFHLVTEPTERIRYLKLQGNLLLPALQDDASGKQ